MNDKELFYKYLMLINGNKDKKIGDLKKDELLEVLGVAYCMCQALSDALDKACEELEKFSFGTKNPGFPLMSFDEWKEWCMK